MMFSRVTWVLTLVLMGPEFAFHRSRSDGLTHTKRSLDSLGDPESTEEHGDHDGHEGELDARVLPPLYSSADRRFREWEDVVWDSFAGNYEDHPVTRRDESDIIALVC